MKTITKHISRFRMMGWLLVLAFLAGSCEDLTGPGDNLDRLVDGWMVVDLSEPLKSAKATYWVEIEKHPFEAQTIRIFDFNGLGEGIVAEASLNGSILTLSSQVLAGGFTIQGSGEVQKNWNEIHWTYTVDDGSGQLLQVTAVYTRLSL
jgi:hypothetical protein